MILILIAGILIGYGLKSGIRDVLRSIRYHIWAFWNYKIMKRPEPDPTEVMMNVIPIAMMAGIMANVVSSMQKVFGDEVEEKIQYMAKKKSK